jgi:putative DNA primase/helicase
MLEMKLRDEAPRILAWALQGCLDWQKHGLARPESVTVATDEYFEDQDVFGQWIEERCQKGPKLWEQPTTLFNDWSRYAKSAGEDAGTIVGFASRMKKLGFKKTRTMSFRCFQGISLRFDSRNEQNS